MKISGEVVDTSSKVITAKATGKKFRVHYIELDGGEVVNVGFKNPYEVGHKVSLDVEEKYGELKATGNSTGSGSSSGNASGSSDSKGSGGYRGGASGRPFPVPKTSGELAIIRQNALTNAVTMFCNGALEFVPNKDDMKSVDELIEEVIKMAYAFAEFSSGQREVKLASVMEEKATKRARKIVKRDEEEDEVEDEVA